MYANPIRSRKFERKSERLCQNWESLAIRMVHPQSMRYSWSSPRTQAKQFPAIQPKRPTHFPNGKSRVAMTWPFQLNVRLSNELASSNFNRKFWNWYRELNWVTRDWLAERLRTVLLRTCENQSTARSCCCRREEEKKRASDIVAVAWCDKMTIFRHWIRLRLWRWLRSEWVCVLVVYLVVFIVASGRKSVLYLVSSYQMFA